jgi:predicted phage baseplate assembly protein
MLRHGGRAVTAEDNEDQARLASAEVARCLAVPLLDLATDPDGWAPRPGTVTVVVVPGADSARPAPSVELVDRVADHLRGCAPPGVRIVVTGPEYLRVDVRVGIGLAALDGAGAVSTAVKAALEGFLHPLTGGRDGAGWAFGRQPHRSDITALLQAVPGVDHLRRLEIDLVPDRAGAEATRRFLLCSGLHAIDLVVGS